jgi:hypothetical protein
MEPVAPRPAFLASAWRTIFFVVLALGWNLSSAQSDVPEHKVKAAIVYRLLGFVEWPPRAFASADTPLVIGVIGADAFAQELGRTVGAQRVGDRAVHVQSLSAGDPLTGVHVLFVGGRQAGRVNTALEGVKGRPILTITEVDEQGAATSIVNLLVLDERVRFDIGMAAANEAQIRISARLLPLARKVYGERS